MISAVSPPLGTATTSVFPASANPSNASSVPRNEVSGQSAASAAKEPARKPTDTDAAARARGLDDADLKVLSELKARDREVRAHEAAHQSVGGQYAGAVSYVYQRGPDGAQYAVGGEVSIDVAPVQGDPQATIEKMRVVRAAAMAPAEPSAQDRAVAAQAMQIMLQAQTELSQEMAGSERAGARQEASEAYGTVARMDGDEPAGSTSVTA